MIMFKQLNHRYIGIIESIHPFIIDISHLKMSIHFYYHFECHFVIQLIYLVFNTTITTIPTLDIFQPIFFTNTSLPIHIAINNSVDINNCSTSVLECFNTNQLVLSNLILNEICNHTFDSNH